MRLSVLAIVGCLFALVAGSANAKSPDGFEVAHDDKGEPAVLAEVTHDLCDRRFALLGEGPTHGDGATEAFKVALVERLIDQCGYRSVVFEASQYEFFALRRRLQNGQAVALNNLAEAVGGLRRSDQELQPLLPFLLDKVRAGQIYLAGIDDQLGGAGDTYANDEMILELVTALPAGRRRECAEDFRRRSYFDYPDISPYSASDHRDLLSCLDDMTGVQMQRLDATDRREHLHMIDSLRRYIGRDQSSDRDQWLARDKSMFETLKWLLAVGDVRGKTIIWGATVHLAKADFDSRTAAPLLNFGSLMHAAFGDDAFVLGFSALGGSIRVNRSIVTDLPIAPTNSLESQTLKNSSETIIYLDSRQLRAAGTEQGAALDHSYEKIDWLNLLDGLVIFREEHPTHRLPSETR